jgi:hypothetical protein
LRNFFHDTAFQVWGCAGEEKRSTAREHDKEKSNPTPPQITEIVDSKVLKGSLSAGGITRFMNVNIKF